jgi:hypothetical protein
MISGLFDTADQFQEGPDQMTLMNPISCHQITWGADTEKGFAETQELGYPLPIFCELGLGTIDFAPILDAIREIDYTGWLTVEIDQSTSTPIQSLRQCRDWAVRNLGSTFEPTLVA